jgi:hypothetical protein
VAEMPNLGALADGHVVVDVTAFVYVIFVHSIFKNKNGPSTGSEP